MASVVENLVKTRLPTPYGEFSLYLYDQNGKEHLALVNSVVAGQRGVPVRVHSECITGDIFSSRRCDCGDQLRHALAFLGRSECGVLIYLRQEGRGIGLNKKLQAYNLQDQGLDTVEANVSLGHQPDEREYEVAALILNDLAIESIRLITNNPRKVDDLVRLGIQVENRIPIEVGQHADNLDYLRSKVEKMSHWITFRETLPTCDDHAYLAPLLDALGLARQTTVASPPFITLHYTQTLNGRVMSPVGVTETSMQSAGLLHYLGQQHDAVLVDLASLRDGDLPGIGTGTGVTEFARIIVVDDGTTSLDDWEAPPDFAVPPIVLSTGRRACVPDGTAWLTGALHLASDQDETGPCAHQIQDMCHRMGIKTLLVTGTGTLIRAFQNSHCVNYCVITINPYIVHDLPPEAASINPARTAGLSLRDCHYHSLDTATVVCGVAGQP